MTPTNEDLRYPPYTHGRTVCRTCSAVVAQCRCAKGCEVVATVARCGKCPAESTPSAAPPAPEPTEKDMEAAREVIRAAVAAMDAAYAHELTRPSAAEEER